MAKKILIVDDSESIREVVCFTLQKSGHEVQKAVDGQDALKYLDGTPYDLIITDLHMPPPNGIELIKIIRASEKYSNIPILMLTTEAEEKKKFEAKDAGATGWITKPFSPDRLTLAVRKIIN